MSSDYFLSIQHFYIYHLSPLLPSSFCTKTLPLISAFFHISFIIYYCFFFYHFYYDLCVYNTLFFFLLYRHSCFILFISPTFMPLKICNLKYCSRKSVAISFSPVACFQLGSTCRTNSSTVCWELRFLAPCWQHKVLGKKANWFLWSSNSHYWEQTWWKQRQLCTQVEQAWWPSVQYRMLQNRNSICGFTSINAVALHKPSPGKHDHSQLLQLSTLHPQDREYIAYMNVCMVVPRAGYKRVHQWRQKQQKLIWWQSLDMYRKLQVIRED